MYCFRLSLVAFALIIQIAISASISPEIGTEESIRNNLIGYGNDLIEGLSPPKVEAKNYFRAESAKSVLGLEHPYTVEIHAKYIEIKTSGFSSEKIKLNRTETEGVQKVAVSFAQLLNTSKLSSEAMENQSEIPESSELHPVIVITNSGISIQFLNVSETGFETTEVSPENKQILWDFLRKYTRNILEEKLKRLELNEKYAEVLESPTSDAENSFAFENFIDFLWAVMKLSVGYAETAFGGWTTSEPDTAAVGFDREIPSSTVTLFGYEEPSPFHEFPSQEFQHRGKDTDSIFYGRGVV